MNCSDWTLALLLALGLAAPGAVQAQGKKKPAPASQPVLRGAARPAPASQPVNRKRRPAAKRGSRLSAKDMEILKHLELLENLHLLEAMDLLHGAGSRKK